MLVIMEYGSTMSIMLLIFCGVFLESDSFVIALQVSFKFDNIS